MNNLETIKKHAWLEIVNLVIPTHNDAPADIRRMCKWIKETLGADTPVHFSRFTPAYRLTQLPPTQFHVLSGMRKTDYSPQSFSYSGQSRKKRQMHFL
jgi:pyruvate formate lyase activating enzyme